MTNTEDKNLDFCDCEKKIKVKSATTKPSDTNSESSQKLTDNILCNKVRSNDIANFSQNSQISDNNKSVSVNTESCVRGSNRDLNLNLGNLKCGSLNVCGLKPRLNYEEFKDTVKEHDIFCVSETKIDKYDIITLESYTFLSQWRKQSYLRKSGGIGVFIKDEIFPYVTAIESDSDYIFWFKISCCFVEVLWP